jgi:hypothetical protein
MFSDKQIKNLLKLFEKEFGIKVSPEEACKYASWFLDILTIVYKESNHEEALLGPEQPPPEKKKEPQSRSG